MAIRLKEMIKYNTAPVVQPRGTLTSSRGLRPRLRGASLRGKRTECSRSLIG